MVASQGKRGRGCRQALCQRCTAPALPEHAQTHEIICTDTDRHRHTHTHAHAHTRTKHTHTLSTHTLSTLSTHKSAYACMEEDARIAPLPPHLLKACCNVDPDACAKLEICSNGYEGAVCAECMPGCVFLSCFYVV